MEKKLKTCLFWSLLYAFERSEADFGTSECLAVLVATVLAHLLVSPMVIAVFLPKLALFSEASLREKNVRFVVAAFFFPTSLVHFRRPVSEESASLEKK